MSRRRESERVGVEVVVFCLYTVHRHDLDPTRQAEKQGPRSPRRRLPLLTPSLTLHPLLGPPNILGKNEIDTLGYWTHWLRFFSAHGDARNDAAACDPRFNVHVLT